MEQLMNAEQQQQQTQSTLRDSLIVDSSPEPQEGIIREVK